MSDAIICHQMSSDVIRCHQRSSEVIRGMHSEVCNQRYAIRGYQRLSEECRTGIRSKNHRRLFPQGVSK